MVHGNDLLSFSRDSVVASIPSKIPELVFSGVRGRCRPGLRISWILFWGHVKTFALPLEDPLINEWISIEDAAASGLTSRAKFLFKAYR